MQDGRSRSRAALLVVLICLLIFRNPLESLISALQYLDETLAALSIPLAAAALVRGKLRPLLSRRVLAAAVSLAVFEAVGWISSFVYHYQPLFNAAADAFLTVKFFLMIVTAVLLFQNTDWEKTYKKSAPWILAFTVGLFVLLIADELFDLFPTDSRYGMRSVVLFYKHQTYLASAGVMLMAFWMRTAEYFGRRTAVPMALSAILTLATLRAKALAAVAAAVILCIIILVKKRHPGWQVWLLSAISAALIAAEQMLFYIVDLIENISGRVLNLQISLSGHYLYSSGDETARTALFRHAPTVALDHLPLGAGWATYGSNFSISPYSPLYTSYGLDHVWGLSPEFSEYVCDSFWPMILAQTGWLGLIAYALAVLFVVLGICGFEKRNRYTFCSGLVSIVYMLILSTAETAFAGVSAALFGMWLGVLFAESGAEG